MPRVSKKNISEFQEVMLEWYQIKGRHTFPWRDNGLTNYQLIIAEVLLQRTKAETISKFYLPFLQLFPSWESISQSEINFLEESLKPIGLYRQRASRLRNLAIEMIKRQNILPEGREELESIPFMGQYIANAIELLIFKKNSYLLDINMSRVLERYFGERKLADIRYDPYLQKLAQNITNHTKSKEVNWAILDFAAIVCKANKPLCDICPLSLKCTYYQSILKGNDKLS